MFKGADLDKIESIRATVGQIPFNFQIGKDASSIPLVKPRGIAGEFEVRLDNCDGPLLTSMSLEYARQSYALTTLPPAKMAAQKGKHDLCLRFTRAAIDPIWTIDSVELVGN
jgi:hexosaminidase